MQTGGTRTHYSIHQAKRAGDAIGVDWSKYDLTDLMRAMNEQHEAHTVNHTMSHTTSDYSHSLEDARAALAHIKGDDRTQTAWHW